MYRRRMRLLYAEKRGGVQDFRAETGKMKGVKYFWGWEGCDGKADLAGVCGEGMNVSGFYERLVCRCNSYQIPWRGSGAKR